MTWIEVVPPSAADGALRATYDALLARRGKLSNIMTVQSLNPTMMRAHLDLYIASMFEQSGLSRAEREMVAVHVSVVNGCENCKRQLGPTLNLAQVSSFPVGPSRGRR